jgi:hypothetical protein
MGFHCGMQAWNDFALQHQLVGLTISLPRLLLRSSFPPPYAKQEPYLPFDRRGSNGIIGWLRDEAANTASATAGRQEKCASLHMGRQRS